MDMRRRKMLGFAPLVLALLLAAIVVITASAEPVSETRPFYDVDWTSAGVGGVGGGSGVIYDDGNDTNNQGLVFYEGNDSNNPQGYPGDAVDWDANINYQGGGMPMPSCMSPMARLF